MKAHRETRRETPYKLKGAISGWRWLCNGKATGSWLAKLWLINESLYRKRRKQAAASAIGGESSFSQIWPWLAIRRRRLSPAVKSLKGDTMIINKCKSLINLKKLVTRKRK